MHGRRNVVTRTSTTVRKMLTWGTDAGVNSKRFCRETVKLSVIVTCVGATAASWTHRTA